MAKNRVTPLPPDQQPLPAAGPEPENGQPAPTEVKQPPAPGADVKPEPVAAPPAPGPTTEPVINPFDPKTYKNSPSLDVAAGVRKHLTGLFVGSPQGESWVRRHPSEEYSFDAWTIQLKDERETYLILPPIRAKLLGEPALKRRMFYLAVTMQGKLFIWSVRIPADDTKQPDRWMRAPLEAVRLAKDQWTRIQWNEETRQHDVGTCEFEAEPEWPDLSMEELNKLAFKDLIIDSLDHPILKRLRGQAR
jgi:hypothetical protein